MLVIDRNAAEAAGRHDRQQRTLADAFPFSRQPHFAGPYLGARQIHQDLEALTRRLLRRARMTDHAFPAIGAIMRAVDAHGLDVAFGEPPHERRVVGRFGRTGDEERARTGRGRRAQKLVGALAQAPLAGEEALRGRSLFARKAGKRGKRGLHRHKRRKNPAFQSAQRGKPQRHQWPLQGPQIATAESHVGGKVCRAFGEARANHAVGPGGHLPVALATDVGDQRVDLPM
jgi:hypothetical protein